MPNEILHHVLGKHSVDAFYCKNKINNYTGPCDGANHANDYTRKLSDDQFADRLGGPTCGHCHVVISNIYNIVCFRPMVQVYETKNA